MPTLSDLKQRQALPLEAKVSMTKVRIREWYNHWDGDVYISFSGGKDSTVLAHIVHDIYPDVPMVFSNTGLEYPEIQQFARNMDAEFVRPKMMFSDVISKYGYPIISKEVSRTIREARQHKNTKNSMIKRAEFAGERIDPNTGELSKFQKVKWLPLARDTLFRISDRCCSVMKKAPLHDYQKKTKRVPYIGTLAEESALREMKWLDHGCNAFEGNTPSSQPMSFWKEQDVLHYIKQEGLEIASVYGEILADGNDGYLYQPMPGIDCKLKCSGCQRTGCIFCGFGCYLDKGETRFQRLAKTHPKQYEYCLNGGQWVDNEEYDPTLPKYHEKWKHWNPKKIWVPSKNGLGMKKVFDDCNALYGKDFIRYE